MMNIVSNECDILKCPSNGIIKAKCVNPTQQNNDSYCQCTDTKYQYNGNACICMKINKILKNK